MGTPRADGGPDLTAIDVGGPDGIGAGAGTPRGMEPVDALSRPEGEGRGGITGTGSGGAADGARNGVGGVGGAGDDARAAERRIS